MSTGNRCIFGSRGETYVLERSVQVFDDGLGFEFELLHTRRFKNQFNCNRIKAFLLALFPTASLKTAKNRFCFRALYSQ